MCMFVSVECEKMVVVGESRFCTKKYSTVVKNVEMTCRNVCIFTNLSGVQSVQIP